MKTNHYELPLSIYTNLITFVFLNIKELMQKAFRIVILLAVILTSTALFAQPGPPTGPPCGGPFGPACPIDGGVSILIAAGLAYGGKKSYDMARKKS
jgi:hypothetical protein